MGKKWAIRGKCARDGKEMHQYPSDISREEFEEIREDLDAAKKKARPRKYDLYDVFCAVLYVVQGGTQLAWLTVGGKNPTNGLTYTAKCPIIKNYLSVTREAPHKNYYQHIKEFQMWLRLSVCPFVLWQALLASAGAAPIAACQCGAAKCWFGSGCKSRDRFKTVTLVPGT